MLQIDMITDRQEGRDNGLTDAIQLLWREWAVDVHACQQPRRWMATRRASLGARDLFESTSVKRVRSVARLTFLIAASGLPACTGEDAPEEEHAGVAISDKGPALVGEGGFGISADGRQDLDLDGQIDLVVGSSTAGVAQAGTVYVFCNGLLEDAPTIADACGTIEGANTFSFGYSVTVAENLSGGEGPTLVAAESIDYPDNSVYLFTDPIQGVWSTEDATAEITDDGREFSAHVQLASMQDMDGDRWGELVVAQPRDNRDGGRIYLFQGALSGTLSLEDATATIDATHGQDLGWAVTSVGDTDGDGLDDLLLGGEYDFSYMPLGGGAWLFRGGVEGAWVDEDADLVVRDKNGGRQVGWSVSWTGDADGDGLDDLLIGVLDEDEEPGGAYLYCGPDTGSLLLDAADAYLRADDPEASRMGNSVSGAGDVDMDGYVDFLVGLGADGEGGYLAGAAWIARGPISGVVNLGKDQQKLVGSEKDLVGWGVMRGGDLDGDGTPDPLVHARGYEEYSGALFVLTDL